MSDERSERRVPVKEPQLELFRAALDASPHGVELREDGRVLYRNAAWERLRGHAAQTEPMDVGVVNCGRSGPPLEIQRQQVQQQQYGFEYNGAPVQVTIAADVTDRRRLESQLREAQRLESLGRWVGGVVHDFKNLLTAVMLYSDLVAQSVSAESAAARYNEEVRQAVRRGAEVAGQLLAFAREEPSERCVFSLNSMLKRMTDVLQRMTGEDVELVLSPADSPCNIMLEPAQVQQVVFNLALNARDAMPDGGRLEIGTYEIDESSDRNGNAASGWVGLEVSDNGCGMTADVLLRIFEPFFTTKPVGKGTGLGLTTVRSIVQQNGGKISVDSEPGRGTRVSILLPRATSETRTAGDVHNASEPRGSETILIVEDEISVRSSMSQVLMRCGYEVLEAGSGTEALRVFAEAKKAVDLLVCDLVLPGISGREVARRLVGLRPGMRVLFISGYGEPGTTGIHKCVVVEKPFNREALALKVREALDAEAPRSGRGGSELGG